MPAKDNTILTTNLAQMEARKVDFVTRFERTWKALSEIMDVMRPVEKPAGTQLYSYKVKVGELKGGVSVGEGEDIPYTDVTFEPVSYGDLKIEKYAKAVTLEAVEKYGAELAIDKADDEFRISLQEDVLNRFYAFAKTGELEVEADNFKQGIAKAIGSVKSKFQKMRKDGSNIVLFLNTMDYYNYLGSADITVQNSEGITYLKNFMGAQTVILTSEIDEGTIIAIPANNIVLYYTNPAQSAFAKMGLDYTVSGETNLIGYAVEGKYGNATSVSYALMGFTMFAEYIDAVAVVTVGAGEEENPEGE